MWVAWVSVIVPSLLCVEIFQLRLQVKMKNRFIWDKVMNIKYFHPLTLKQNRYRRFRQNKMVYFSFLNVKPRFNDHARLLFGNIVQLIFPRHSFTSKRSRKGKKSAHCWPIVGIEDTQFSSCQHWIRSFMTEIKLYCT